MRLRIGFDGALAPERLQGLRDRYLDDLPEAQDALLELLVRGGAPHAITARGRDVGHVVVHEGGTLVEFFVHPEAEDHSHHILPEVVRRFGLRAALVKTFDHNFLSCALELQTSVRVRGALIRHYARAPLPDIARIRYAHRVATPADVPAVLALDQDVFTRPDRLHALAVQGGLHLYEREARLVGIGVLRPIVAGRPHVEVGIAVDRPFRNRGYAPYILRDLADACVARGLVPVSGCARDNEASIRVGLRVGFRARYRLLEIGFRPLGAA